MNTKFDLDSLVFNSHGLIPAIAQDQTTGEVLMMAWMNAETISETLATGRVVYWSRSRMKRWAKGETSGNVQQLVDFRVDCDRDCLLLMVNQTGPACHTLRRSCYYTAIRDGEVVVLSEPEQSS